MIAIIQTPYFAQVPPRDADGFSKNKFKERLEKSENFNEKWSPV
jgi:hypothetical protein